MTVPAVFPVGKTQWRKWSDRQRGEFNRLRSDGVPHQDAIDMVNTAGFAPASAPAPTETETVAPAPAKPRAPRKPRTKKA